MAWYIYSDWKTGSTTTSGKPLTGSIIDACPKTKKSGLVMLGEYQHSNDKFFVNARETRENFRLVKE